MRRPRSDVVLRRFLAGESVDYIASALKRKDKTAGFFEMLKAVEDALRRGWLRMEARARKKRRRK